MNTILKLLISALAIQTTLNADNLERIYVGELSEKWEFSSDHLPIGAKLDNDITIVSWNVLNTAYLHWIYNNDQGLANSQITRENIPFNNITLRDQHNISHLLEMVSNNKHIICLQECSEPFIQTLLSYLPKNIKIVRSSENAVKNQNIILYDADLFELIEKTLHQNAFPSDPRPLMEVVFRDQSTQYRIYNAHLKCDAAKSHRFELADFVLSRLQTNEITVILGDLNVDQGKMIEALNNPAFLAISPYKTTVSPELESKAIDHIFIFGSSAEALRANDVLLGLQLLVNILNKDK